MDKRRSKKKKKKMSRAAKVTIIVVIAIVVVAAALFCSYAFIKCTTFDVTATIDVTNTEAAIEVFEYKDGYVKCTGDGLTCFDKNGVKWNETFAMAQPLCDVAGDYIAAADMKSNEIFLYDSSGFAGTLTVPQLITDLEVSELGTVAVAAKDGRANYIEVLDSEGNELVNVKTVFNLSGYLMDISMSSDGERLAACFSGVKDASITSKVIFYDFTKNANAGEKLVTGTFDQYKNTILTTVEFVADNRAVAVGDNVVTVYDATGTPEIISEMTDFPYEIRSLFFDRNHIGMVVDNDEGDDAYAIRVYNLNCKEIMNQTFNYNYTKAGFAGLGVYVCSDYDLDVYNYFGVYKFSGTMEARICEMTALKDGLNYIYMTEDDTRFIRLR